MPATQSAFRFRNDDGNETTATWNAALNTNISIAPRVNFRPRIQIDTTGAWASNNPLVHLQYRRVGDTFWRRPMVESASQSYTWGGMSSYLSGGTGATGSLVLSAGSVATDNGHAMLIAIIAQKPATANGGTMTPPANWTLLGKFSGGGYGATLGSNTGNPNLYIYYKLAQGDEGANFTFTYTDNGVCNGHVCIVRPAVEGTWSIATASGEDTVGDTSSSIVCGSDPGVLTGDFIIGAVGMATGWFQYTAASEAFSQSGVTFGAVTEQVEGQATNVCWLISSATVTAGPSSGVPTISATLSGTVTNCRGPGVFIRLRCTPSQPCIIKVSSVVNDGATTAQLTPPGVKTTSDFVAGQILDTNNGNTNQALGSDKYTENEYSLQFTELALDGEAFDFRLLAPSNVGLANGALTSYTQVPRATISDPNAGSGILMGMMM